MSRESLLDGVLVRESECDEGSVGVSKRCRGRGKGRDGVCIVRHSEGAGTEGRGEKGGGGVHSEGMGEGRERILREGRGSA